MSNTPVKDSSCPALALAALRGSAIALLGCLATETNAAAAPEKPEISIKTLSYQDYNEDADRIDIDAKAVQFLLPYKGEWTLGGTVVHDAISGASPRYHTSALTDMVDSRNAYTANLTRYFRQDTISAGYAYSKERDYVSRNYSLQNAWSTADQNTTWTGGVSYSADEILPNSIFLRTPRDKKVLEVVAGLTQVISQNDLAQLTLRHSRSRGYFSDQYKLYDLRPSSRDANSLLARWNHYFADTGTTLRASYRYYHDNFGIDSHTIELDYVIELPQQWQLTPSLRYYSQTAADFYFDPVANDPFADADTVGAPISVVYNRYVDELPASMDQRLSAFGGVTWGLKVDKEFGRHLGVDIKFEQYEQRSNWALGSGSPDIGNFYARSVQLGARYKF
jgi:hypothetical protein